MENKPDKSHGRLSSNPLEGALSAKVDRFAHIAMTIVVDVVALIVGLGMLYLVVGLVEALIDVFRGGGTEAVLGLVEGALTIFIFIEIFESFLEYMREKKVSVKLMLDLSLIIVLREVWLAAISHAEAVSMLAFAALVLAIGAVRVAVAFADRSTTT